MMPISQQSGATMDMGLNVLMVLWINTTGILTVNEPGVFVTEIMLPL